MLQIQFPFLNHAYSLRKWDSSGKKYSSQLPGESESISGGADFRQHDFGLYRRTVDRTRRNPRKNPGLFWQYYMLRGETASLSTYHQNYIENYRNCQIMISNLLLCIQTSDSLKRHLSNQHVILKRKLLLSHDMNVGNYWKTIRPHDFTIGGK